MKFHLKSTLARLSCGYILGVLTSAKQNVEFLVHLRFVQRTDSSVSAWELEIKTTHFLECLRVEQLAETITAASEKHAEIFCESQGENFISVDVFGLNNLFRINFLSNQASMVGAKVDSLIEWTPFDISNFVVSWSFKFFDVSRASFFLDTPSDAVLQIVNSQFPFFGLVLENNDEVLVAVGELNFQSIVSRDCNLSKLISVNAVVNFDSNSGCGGKHIFRILCHIYIFARIVNLEKSNSIVKVSVVHANSLIV